MDGDFKEVEGCLHELGEAMQSLQPAKFFGQETPPLIEDTSNQIESQAQELTTVARVFLVVPSYTHHSITNVCWVYVIVTGMILSTPFNKVLSLTNSHRVITVNVRFVILSSTIKYRCAVRASSEGSKVIGLVNGNLSLTYFLLTLICGSIVAVVVQLILKKLRGEVKGRLYRNAY
uniref:t-SNARE coiled-coil homology domain-containing protein n=1 Tax=Angiostrongylus cantonensis TaxID=6313 RepID=A0A0K0DMW9_ANGCA